MQKFWTIK